MTAGERSTSRLLARGLLFGLALALALHVAPAAATPVISAGNLPYSGISPGGVDMATGELILVMRPDLVVDGPFPLVFRRYYASMLQREGFTSSKLGPNWLHTYDHKLSVSGSNATLVTNRGEVIRFVSGSGGTWNLVSPTYAPFKLDQLPIGTWRVRNPIDRRVYFFDGVTWLLTQILDEHGNALNLTYSGGQLSQVSDGLGRVLSFTYEPATGFLSQVSDGTRTVHFNYTTGVLTGFIDAAGKPWAYATNPGPIQALITGVTEPLGNTPITHSYDPLGRVSTQMDALGHTAQYNYDTPTGNVYTDPQGNPWTYQHDPLKLTSLKDPIGGSALYTYDPLGRPDTFKRPMGDPTSYSYDPASGYVSSIHFPDGSSISLDHGSHLVSGAEIFDVTAAHYPDGTNAVFGRDPAGNLNNYQDQAGFPWMGTYNPRGQVLTWQNPGGGTTTFTYDTQGRPATVRDNTGNTASYIYDPLSRLVQVNWPGGANRQYGYDNLDNLTVARDENGNPWNFIYDDNGQLTNTIDPRTSSTTTFYDAADNVRGIEDPLGHSTLFDYDLNGRLFHETDRSGRVTTYMYDALNRLSSVADPAGAPTSFGYDGDSRLTFEQDPLGHSSTFQYDFMDRLTRVIDPVSSELDYTYDPMGRLHQVTGPLGFVQIFGYDPRGLMTSASNGTSTVQYQYTPHRRLSQITDPNGNPWPYNYDPQGRLTSASDPLGRANSYGYDERSRLTRITMPDLTQELISYDGNGNVTGRSYTDGTAFTYGYDIANRITSATGYSFTYDNADRMMTSNGFSYGYDFEGRLTSETISPGKTVGYGYDPRGLLSQVSDWAGGNTSFSFDTAHRLTGITRPNGVNAAYGYDNADRMTSAVEAGPGPSSISSIQITRDALGRIGSINRIQPLMPGATMPASSPFAYDVASQVNGVSHDALGRTTLDGTRALSWNGASHLTSYSKSGADSLNYTDDGSSNPTTIQPHSGGSAIQLAWGYGRGYPTNDDMAVSLPSRWRSNIRTPSGLLLYGMDGASDARTFYHYDEAGNTSFLTNDVGHVTTEYAYGPFGGVSALGQTTDNLFTFGAVRGMLALTTNGVTTGLWHSSGGVYDERTMRMVSRLVTQAGAVEGEISSDAYSRIKVRFPWQQGGKNPGPGGDPGSLVELNPQPLPPGAMVALNPQPYPPGSMVSLNPQPFPPGASVALNPQPFPPDPCFGSKAPGPTGDPGSLVELNPQPFPPAPGSSVALNPQPFPPAPGEWVGLNPQPFPPSPYSPDAVALNPQPFPPAPDAFFMSAGGLQMEHGVVEYWEGGLARSGASTHNRWDFLDAPMTRPPAPRGVEGILITAAQGIPPSGYTGYKGPTPWVPTFTNPNPRELLGNDHFTSILPFHSPCFWCPQ